MSAVLLLLCTVLPAIADLVYFDNSSEKWTTPYIHYWGNNGSTYPGVAMSNTEKNDIWKYDVPSGTKAILFNAGDGDKSKTGDFSFVANHIYNRNGDQGEYQGEVITPGEDMKYTIHFHNNVSWDNVNVTISGAASLEARMISNLNSSIYDISFTAPKNALIYCQFHTLVNGSKQNETSRFKVVDGNVYTISGDKGPLSSYNPNTTLPEAEYWIEPANPTATQQATLYFNRAYNPNGALRNKDVYLHTGLIRTGGDIKDWAGAPSWGNHEKFKMTASADNPDLLSITFSPSIAGWLGVDEGESYNKLGVIFHNGDTKQHNGEQFIALRPTPVAGEGLGAIQNYEMRDDNTIVITSERGKLFITPWSDNVIKVFTLRNSATVTDERESISVIDNATKEAYGIVSPMFAVNETDTKLILSITDGVSVEVDKASSLVSFFNPGQESSAPVLSELGGLVNKTGNVSVTFNGMNDDAFYGGGYNGNLVNFNGQGMEMNNKQEGNWGQGASLTRNICIPFFVSTSGYGVYFDDHFKDAKIYPSSSGTTYSSKSPTPIAYYFIGGGSMESVMQNYTHLTGLAELPPFWALGYITSKFSFATRQEAEDAVKKTKEINIPIDAIVFDIHWQTDNSLRGNGPEGMGSIKWSDAYPNPKEMMSKLRNANVHTIAITEPYFTSKSGNYETLKSNGWLADDHVDGMAWLNSDHVGLLDITNEDARNWYKKLYKDRTSEGIESWWLDLGEPERHDGESQYKGGSMMQVHNEYGNRWLDLAYKAMKEQTPDARFITMPRAGTSGMQRYNAFPWTGDIARSWQGLKAQVPALVSAAMSGVSYMGSDIGGFSATGTDPNLYRRWVQLGVFYPSMRTHSATEPEVWRPAYSGVRDDVRDAINLRYAYLPYTYSQSYAYTRYGTPIARPANFNDDDKSVLNNEIGSYFWGPDMFVAPVLDESTSKSIHFPQGDWLDMNDFSSVYEGHSKITYDAPVWKIPRFMRRGAFIVRYRQDTFTSTAEIETSRLTVDHFATNAIGTPGSSFYDDDHKDVNAIRDGRYILTHFNAHADGNSMMISIEREGNGWEGMNRTQDILFRIHDFAINDGSGNALPYSMVRLYQLKRDNSQAANAPEAAASVSMPFTAVQSEDAVKSASGPAFYHDVNGKHLYLRLPEAASDARYTLELGQSGVLTGTDMPVDIASMTLSYGNGILSYSAPEGTENLRIEVFSATGATAAIFDGLKANGYVAQQTVSLPAGIYIARLSGSDSAGLTQSRTVKMIVR